MRKKQQKERSMVQKTQCTAIEKLVKSKGRYGNICILELEIILFFIKIDNYS